MLATHGRFGATATNAPSTRSSQTPTPGTWIVVRPRLRATMPLIDAGPAHQPLDPLALDPDAVGHQQLGVDARRSIDLAGLAVDLANALGQPFVLERPARTARAGPRRESPTATPRARGTSS